MGRHSRPDRGGAPAAPPPSPSDTGSWEQRWERTGSQPPVVDGPRPGPATGAVAFPLGGSRGEAGWPALRSVAPPPPEPPGGGGRRRAGTYADLVPPPPSAPTGRGQADQGPPLGRFAPPTAIPNGRGPADTGSGLGRLGPPGGGPTAGGGRADTGSGLWRLGADDTGSGIGGFAQTDAGSGLGRVAPPAGGPGAYGRSLPDTGSGLAGLGDVSPGRGPRGVTDTDSGLRRVAAYETGSGLGRVGSTDVGAGPGRAGATRADLVPPLDDGEPPPVRGRRRAHPDTAGATALMPTVDTHEPDEVTDTGARRARSAFRVAEEPDEDDYDEPSLVLQWGIFIAQTLTGAAVGLGVWLGFYRLWSTWPFYAAPAVGASMILMLVVARILRRRYGHELDLLTAVVTIGVGTVLTVLPAAFTLQSLG